MATIKCSNRNIFVDINALKRSEYFRPVLFNALSFKGSGLLTGLQGMGPGKLFYPDLRTLDFGVFFTCCAWIKFLENTSKLSYQRAKTIQQ